AVVLVLRAVSSTQLHDSGRPGNPGNARLDRVGRVRYRCNSRVSDLLFSNAAEDCRTTGNPAAASPNDLAAEFRNATFDRGGALHDSYADPQPPPSGDLLFLSRNRTGIDSVHHQGSRVSAPDLCNRPMASSERTHAHGKHSDDDRWD